MTCCVFGDPGPMAASLGLQGAMVSYLATDALEEDAGPRFRRGDEVRFKVGGVTHAHNTGRLLRICGLNAVVARRLGNPSPSTSPTSSRFEYV